jgi:hypothetical protein
MRRVVPMFLFLLLCPLWAVPGQQSGGSKFTIQGGERVQEEKEQPGQPLTNESIIKLVKAGLGEATIINIVNTQPGKYSLRADDIIALKKAGVSEKVITAMLNKSANSQVPPTSGLHTAGPPAGDSSLPKPPPPPNFFWPDAPAVAVPPPPPRPPIPAHQVAQTVVFDDAAYHRCSAQEDLMTVMTPEQKAAFKDEGPCPFSEEIDRAYHDCLRDADESICAIIVSDPNYVRSHPATIAIGKVRKVYVDKFFGAGGIKKMIRNGTCLEVVDSPDEADALLRVDYERQEYDGTESGDIDCSRFRCTDGVTIADESGVHHIIREKFILVDPHSDKKIEGWSQYKSGVHQDDFAVLNIEVGCEKRN